MTSAAGRVSTSGALSNNPYLTAIPKIGRSLVSKSYYIYDGLSAEENFTFDLRAFLIERGCEKVERRLGGQVINDYALLVCMLHFGGFSQVVNGRRLKDVARHMRGGNATPTSASTTLHRYYHFQLYAYEHALVHGADAIAPEVPQKSILRTPKPLGALKPLGAGVTGSLLAHGKRIPQVIAQSSSTPQARSPSPPPPGLPLASTGVSKETESVAVVARQTVTAPLLNPLGEGECTTSPDIPEISSSKNLYASRSNGGIVKARTVRIRKSRSKIAVQLRELMRSKPEVSLQFLERETTLSRAVIEQFVDGSATWDTRGVGNVMRTFLRRFQGIDQMTSSGAVARPSCPEQPSRVHAWSNITTHGTITGWERCEVLSAILAEPPQGRLAPPPSPSSE